MDQLLPDPVFGPATDQISKQNNKPLFRTPVMLPLNAFSDISLPCFLLDGLGSLLDENVVAVSTQP